MNHTSTAPNSIRYGRNLVQAGLTGIRNGQDSARGNQSLSTLASGAAQDSLGIALLGACLGVLGSCLLRRRGRLSNALAFGTVGSAVGFLAGFGWKTRGVTTSVAHSAARELRRARDEHWLECNPIDYA